MTKKSLCFNFLILLLVACSPRPEAAGAPALDLQPCHLEGGLEARCGALTVFENRAALGYEQINLYGASYGTRAALAYLRLYPERVRSVVLDAVVGPELVLFLQMPRDAQQALEDLFERCTADIACHNHFPELQAEFEGLLYLTR